jgi:hypothetical protein
LAKLEAGSDIIGERRVNDESEGVNLGIFRGRFRQMARICFKHPVSAILSCSDVWPGASVLTFVLAIVAQNYNWISRSQSECRIGIRLGSFRFKLLKLRNSKGIGSSWL